MINAGIVSPTMSTMTVCVTVASKLNERTMMLHSNRKEVEQQIEEIIDEVSVQDLTPTVALRQIMYFLDIYAHKQKLIGMQEIADLYRNGVKI